MKPVQSVLVVFIVCIVSLTYYIGQGEQSLSLSGITDPIILMGQFLSLVHINTTTSIAVLLQNHNISHWLKINLDSCRRSSVTKLPQQQNLLRHFYHHLSTFCQCRKGCLPVWFH